MSVNPHQKAYLDAMGISVWCARPSSSAQTIDSPTASVVENVINQTQDVSKSWDELQSEVSGCQACELHKTRKNTVFGVGSPQANLLIIGEAPGRDEDIKGEPFVGRAGQLLDKMLFSIGLSRDVVFIANILKCRPPNNRDPKKEEAVACASFLRRQIEIIQPKVILAVGRVSAQNLLETDTPIGKLRGKIHTYGNEKIPMLATYHPAYLLRSPSEKRKAWMDLLTVKNILHS